MFLVVYFFIGLFAGFMAGMFGIGGGSVRTPLLYASGLPLLSAFGINMVVIPFSSLVGAITHRKNINWDYATYIVFGAVAGSITGALLVGVIPTILLAIIFVLISIVTVFGIYLDRISPKLHQKINPNAKNMAGGMFLISLIIGMRGGSGGSLFPPFLKMMKFSMHKAIATSLFTSAFSASAGALIYLFRGDVPLIPALTVIIGSIIGARIGSLLSLKTKPAWLEAGLSMLVVILSLTVLFKALAV